MTTLDRVRVALTGFPGAPGVSTFYFLDVSTAIESLNKFFTAVALQMPNDVAINVARQGDQISDIDGKIVGSWLGGVTAPIQGSGTSSYAAPVGGMVRWTTSTIADGHHVRGRTFLVPLESDNFAINGSLQGLKAASLAAAAAQLVIEQSASFVVWHRPRKAKAATLTRPALTAHVGSNALVTGSSVPTLAAVLRSRRD